jgi:tetratricopeptide (TPR) repeat protein
MLLTSCAKKITVKALNPPNYPQVIEYRRIAIIPFKGQGAELLSLEIEAALSNVYVNGKPFYQIIDRQSIKQILDEQNFTNSGLVDEKDAVKIGRLAGAEGIYTISVLNSRVFSSTTYEKRFRCIDRKCKSLEEYFVRCENLTAVFSFLPRLIDVETGKVVFAKTYTKEAFAKNCADYSYAISGITLLSEAKKKAINEFLKDVAPYKTMQNVVILDEDDDIKNDKDKEKFEKAITFLENNMMDKSCNILKELVEKYPESMVLNYDYGVCKEYFGDLEKAYNYYKKAYELMNEPVEEVKDAFNRINEKLKKYKILKNQI